MGASAGALALGLGVGLRLMGPRQATGSALIDADFVHNRYRYGTQQFTDEASFLAAIGGSKSGITRTIVPKFIGPELVTNGSFASDVSSWDPSGTNGGTDTSFAWSSGKLQATRGAGSQNGSPRQRLTVGGPGRALRFAATITGSARLYAVNPNDGGVLALNSVTGAFTGFGASGDASPVGTVDLGFWPQNASSAITLDDVSVREVGPFAEHSNVGFAAVLHATTPAVASGEKVLLQGDCNGEPDQSYIRLAWGADKHLRLTTHSANLTRATLDLGLVDVSTPFEVRLSAAKDAVRANIGGRGIVRSGTATHPGIAYLRLGRSFSGETWDGTIDSLQWFNRVLTDIEMVEPAYGLQVYGDSTAAGDQADGATTAQKWWSLVANGYDPARPLNNSGVGGETTDQMLARIEADTAHRRWTTIFVDRPNSNAETWVANIKAAVGLLATDRWLVLPPVISVGAGLPDGSGTLIGTIQSILLSDPFFAGHTLDATAQAAYLAAAADPANKDAGGVHFSIAGQAMQAAAVRAFLDARGW